MSSPAPKSPELSDKSKKYDRQIRLWGENGQAILESATVCLINANAVGCEILKSLILPGIGGFTIVDGSVVTEEDIGTNFFLEQTSEGQSKASQCMQFLQELNADANGDYVDESIEFILNNRPEFFNTFDVVIASNLNEKTLLSLSNKLWDAKIPFVYCRSLGFFGSVRLQVKEHCVIEAHPDDRIYDLRLENPFPTLKAHLESTQITPKVPWLIVLNKFLSDWKNNNDGRIPKTYKEKNSLKELIQSGMSNDEENYEEAIKAVNTAFGAGLVSHTIKAILDDDACENINKQSSPFWIMAKALKEFVLNENNNYLPLPGVLPDMTANTESYINLQNIFRQQALQDADNIYRKCQHYLKELGLPPETITDKTVRLFCRESAGLAVVRGTKLADEYEKSSKIVNIVDNFETQGTLAEYYVGFLAYERYQTEFGNIPGELYVENDTSKLKGIANKMLAEWGVHSQISDDLIHEICSYGGAEVHTVSAFIGGCAAQEVIKLITKQYIPIDNTFLYNAITSETETIKL
ncbi:nedd8-activating enzyme E1 regulatory subunit isoform X1 [Episyrphus balteatus]|uniref:nedd8-activating enzyme E1 regulatory subunit isoform X1 n=1 Tax=Episyrphus balteatus TaxID=286459 RepID=UPI00248547CA|nr:nedd8-activating enzyme E1 regulatory subunit isoform X1 [Episyrphus balteatus]